MRPISLTLQGFRSYRQATTIDWEGRTLVAIVGPTGSGKSTILDAVAFALYGKTPRVERDTKSLINQLSELAQVELVFEAGGERWRATRAIKRKGASGHSLRRLLPDGEEETVGALEREVNTHIEEVLGLDFKAFCRSVLLAQNRFAEFLTATPSKRDEVLKGVFGYDKIDLMRETARARLASAEAELAGIGRQREQIAAARAALGGAEAIRKQRASELAAIEKVRPRVQRAQEQRSAAEQTRTQAEDRLRELGEVAASLPDPKDAADLLESVTAADAAVAEARARERAAATAARAAADDAAALEVADGGARALDEAAALLAKVAALEDGLTATLRRAETAKTAADEADASLTATEQALEKVTADAEATAVAAKDAAALFEVRESELSDARHAEMASTLRSTLAEGGICPVCEQPVHALPARRRAAGISQAEKAADRARAALGAATAARERTGAAAEGAKRNVEAARTEGVRARREATEAAAAATSSGATLEAERAAIVTLLGPGDHAAILERRRAAIGEAHRSARERASQAEEARAALDATEAGAEADRARLRELGRALAGAAGRLQFKTPLGDEPAAVGRAFEAVHAEIARASTKATAASEKAGAASAKARGAIGAAMEQAGLDPDGDLDAALLAARGAVAEAQTREEVLRAQVAAAATIDEREASELARRDLLARLSADLTPARFLNHLLAGERALLADLGGHHLERLTDGRYRFTDDGDFDVLDGNAADARRRPDSLSGGETFLASLGLALALAEMVARSGGRLDAFFIDEGFGSLDPEHLDRAMEGIEHLIAEAPHRLVVLVSHVPEIRERIDDLILLASDELTGETRVVTSFD